MDLELEQLDREIDETPAPVKLRQSLPAIELHPMRDQLYNELLSRPYPVISSPSQITHIAVQHGGHYQQEELELLTDLCDRFQSGAPTSSMPCFHQNFGLFELRWERHLEFTGYTFIYRGASKTEPFVRNALDSVPSEWVDRIPGKIVVAFHLHIEDARDRPDLSPKPLSDYFENLTLVNSQPANGLASVWTSFRLHSDGFGRFLIYNRGLNDIQMGRLSQRFIELETYRLMATLGLPLAREISPQLTALDKGLEQVTGRIASVESTAEERELLTTLSTMAAQVESFRARSNYRFSATTAYYHVVQQRLEVLREREREVAGDLTLNEFLLRRLAPAVRTCEVMGTRLADLSTRIDRASELLRTRAQVIIEEQNQQQLKAMNRRIKLQLHLQQTVEGLSVAAISYYLVGLLSVGIDALPALGVGADTSLLKLASVPVVLGLVWLGVRRIHRRISRVESDIR